MRRKKKREKGPIPLRNGSKINKVPKVLLSFWLWAPVFEANAASVKVDPVKDAVT